MGVSVHAASETASLLKELSQHTELESFDNEVQDRQFEFDDLPYLHCLPALATISVNQSGHSTTNEKGLNNCFHCGNSKGVSSG